jgi:RNA polymerase sigma-70 factor (ECF subfamily)
MTASSLIDAFHWQAAMACQAASRVSPEAARVDHLAVMAGDGSEAAFQELLEMFQTKVHRFCWRILFCEEEARDAAQETFVKAWFSLPNYDPRGRFSAWLFRIAINHCRDRAKTRLGRQKQKTTSLESVPELLFRCENQDPAETCATQSDLEKLREGLAALPEKLRLPMVMCCLEGLSQKDAAIVLECSCRAIEGRLRRAREMLEAWWGER